MSLTAPLRARLEALLAGEAGATKTIAAGWLARLAPDQTLEAAPVDALERRFELRIKRRGWVAVPGGYDPTALVEFDVVLRLGYLRTNAGGDLPEGLAEQLGPGLDEAIDDRLATDEAAATVCLTWGPNLDGLTPACFDLQRAPGETRRLEPDGQRVIAELDFVARLEIDHQTPAAHAP